MLDEQRKTRNCAVKGDDGNFIITQFDLVSSGLILDYQRISFWLQVLREVLREVPGIIGINSGLNVKSKVSLLLNYAWEKIRDININSLCFKIKEL